MKVSIEKPGTPQELVHRTVVNDILEHHGTKGMRWGHRKNEQSSKSSKTPGMSPDQQLFAVQSGVVLAILAAHGAYRLKDSGKIHQFSSRNIPLKTNKTLSRKNMSIDSLHSTVVKQINPEFGKPGTKMNCRRCTFAYEMRRRGYDVKATKSTLATGQSGKGLIKAINPKDSPISREHKTISRTSAFGEVRIGDKSFQSMNGQEKSDVIFKHLNSMPHGSRGELVVGWTFGAAHSLAWENIKGKSVIFDTQSGQTYGASSAMAHTIGPIIHEASSTRLDNVKLNTKFLGRWVQNVD